MGNEKRIHLSEQEKNIVGKKCCNCGSTINIMYHHIVPLAHHGTNALSNIACVCEVCHHYIHHEGKPLFNSKIELVKKAKAFLKENDPNWRDGRKKIQVPDFPKYYEMTLNNKITVALAMKELGVSYSKWYRLVKDYKKLNKEQEKIDGTIISS